ncbi:MAG: isocitrate lyase/phosphoenolpyruvate mutase family protein [Planctomycetota bacterium]|nr:isocitrate lyase/phosphoenolpyruvate mutase family protein [Planctomycetota bacterium]
MTPHPGKTLRDLMAQGTVMCPGAFNALVARAVRAAGFESCYISGGATANVAGYPDVGLISLTEMCRTIQEISQASGLPTIADADTGYGDGEMIIRTTIEYDRSGAAGMHIEDQVFPKRCGHLDGKTLISRADMVAKIKASVANKLNPDFIIIARTDARSVTGIDDAIERANAYRDAGADMIFPEGLHSEDEFERFSKESPGLLLANMTEFGKTPYLHVDLFADLGYQLVIYPLSMQRLAMGHVARGLAALKRDGTVEPQLDDMQTRKELYELLAYEPGRQWNYPETPT